MIKKFTKGNDFLKSFLKNKEYIYITTVTHEFSEMTYNWFLSLKNINQEHLALVISLDEKCYNEMLKYNIPTVLLDVKIESNSNQYEWIENEKSYKTIGVHYIIKKYKINTIFSDVDIVFLKNPIERLKNEFTNCDLLVMSDRRFDPFLTEREESYLKVVNYNKTQILNFGKTEQSKNGIKNGGFCYIDINKTNLKKLEDTYKVFYKNSEYFEKFEKGTEAGNLQTLSNKRYDECDLNVKMLNCFEFVNGSIWSIPYLKEKIKNDCYIVHYNYCYESTPELLKDFKINWMKENNHWYV
jgi:hypothetical protein